MRVNLVFWEGFIRHIHTGHRALSLEHMEEQLCWHLRLEILQGSGSRRTENELRDDLNFLGRDLATSSMFKRALKPGALIFYFRKMPVEGNSLCNLLSYDVFFFVVFLTLDFHFL